MVWWRGGVVCWVAVWQLRRGRWVWNMEYQGTITHQELKIPDAPMEFKKGMARARLEIFPNGMHERHGIRKVNCPAPGIG